MAFSNFRWAWHCRGVDARERLVLLLLADQADATGYISRLSHATIRARCGFAYNSRQSKRVIARLIEKGFITRREVRYGAFGNQVSNAYQVDLEHLHPVSGPGRYLWQTARDALTRDADERLRSKVEIHAEGSTAYYDAEGRALVIWLATRHARQFFYSHLEVLLPAVKADPRWPAGRIELLALDS